MINVIKTVINFQIGFLTPSFLSSILKPVTNMLGITGDVPRGAQSRTGFFPPNVQIHGPLFRSEVQSRGDKIEGKSLFTQEGDRIAGLLEDIDLRKREELAAFTSGGSDEMIRREQQLLEDIASPLETRARNQLRDQIVGTTGGLFTTPGGQQAVGTFESEIAADRASRNLSAVDRAFGRQQLLEGQEIENINNLVAFKNSPLEAVKMALNTAAAASQGNIASAKMLANNEIANRQATFNFLDTIFGGFMGTESDPQPLPQNTYSGPSGPFYTGPIYGTQSTHMSPISSTRQQFSSPSYPFMGGRSGY
tara:strand:+ start:1282 stop:2205 length:924 start_codon:yes stop_codon:yes gene_type:complete